MRTVVHLVLHVPAITLLASLAPAQTPGACLVDDSSFTTADGGCKDVATGAIWSAQMPGFASYADAEAYCENLVEGGFDDWRIPSQAELEAVCANGAATHLQLTDASNSFFDKTNGNVGTLVVLSTCQVKKKIAIVRSTAAAVCVRGGSGHGGGHGHGRNGPNSGNGGDSAPRGMVLVRNSLDRGRWTIRVSDLQYRNLAYVLVARGRRTPGAGSAREPCAGTRGTTVTLVGGLNKLDQAGQATIDVSSLNCQSPVTRVDWFLSMVVLDPERSGGVRAVIPLVSPRSVTMAAAR